MFEPQQLNKIYHLYFYHFELISFSANYFRTQDNDSEMMSIE